MGGHLREKDNRDVEWRSKGVGVGRAGESERTGRSEDSGVAGLQGARVCCKKSLLLPKETRQ